jgi:hypothetical protein
MSVKIRFLPQLIQPFPSKCSHTFSDQSMGISVTLVPGENEVTDDEWEVIQSSPAYPMHEEFETMIVRESPRPPEPKPSAPSPPAPKK